MGQSTEDVLMREIRGHLYHIDWLEKDLKKVEHIKLNGLLSVSRRELMAALICAGLVISSADSDVTFNDVASDAVKQTDALLERLEK